MKTEKMTLLEATKKLGNRIDKKNEFICCVVTQANYLDRNIYWNLSDYKVTGVSGCVIWFVKI